MTYFTFYRKLRRALNYTKNVSFIKLTWILKLSRVPFLRAFDVEISERSTLNAFWKLRAVDVKRFLKAQSIRRRTLFESSERSMSNAFWKLRAFDVEISERSTSNAFWKLCVRTFYSDCFQIFEISELSNIQTLQNRWRRLDNEA